MDNTFHPDRGEVLALKERPPSEAVIKAVAEAADTAPTDLHSLHDVVDPDALDALFRGRRPGTLTFEFHGYTVTIRENAEIILRETSPVESR